MTIQEQMKLDLVTARKERDNTKRSALQIAIGEFARAREKTLPDNMVINILKKLIKDEQDGANDVAFIAVIDSYIPKAMSEDDIRAWIVKNVDFGSLQNKMQAVGITTKALGAKAPGATVSKIVREM